MTDDFHAAQVAALGPGGRALYDETIEGFDLEPHELVILLEAARTKDRLDDLNRELASGVTRRTQSGKQTKPASPEARQLALNLARLVAALRLPASQGASRPQRRGTRGVYTIRAAS